MPDPMTVPMNHGLRSGVQGLVSVGPRLGKVGATGGRATGWFEAMTDCVVQGYGEIVMVRLGSFVVLFSFLSDESMACFFLWRISGLRGLVLHW